MSSPQNPANPSAETARPPARRATGVLTQMQRTQTGGGTVLEQPQKPSGNSTARTLQPYICGGSGAIYLMARLPEHAADDGAVVRWLVREHGLATIPGSACGLPGFILGAQSGSSERLQFYLGGEGTGAPLHYHGNAVNLLAHGRKRWFLLPPANAMFSRRPAARWLDKEYPALAASAAPPLELVQEGGDVLFVPAGWAHATLNVEVSVGVVHDNWRVPLVDSCEADKMQEAPR